VFFRVVHLMVDAYQGALPERIGPVAYINYTLNFTCLVAGPIQLYADYRRYESAKPAELAWNAVRTALGRIVTGFFKVSVLSPLVWYFHSRSLEALLGAQGAAERVGFAALVLALFPVYLYFNFSGYTDVVIGAARFLRLELPENFNKPFAARGFIDFWSRWHMSLANWVKTYVYFPLVMALMRRFPSPKLEPLFSVVGYFVAFFLVGVWHGTTSMFVVLGVLLGLGVSVNKLYQIEMIRKLGRKRYLALCEIPFYAAVSRGLTFTWWAISALWFWSSWTQLAQIAALLGPGGLASLFITLAGAASLVLWAPEAGRRIARLVPAALRLPPLYARTVWYTALVVITVSVTVVLEAPAPHIVYRSF
jgi:D-alanyl-lipoteichoic acid acyltransferase DltB (MBOAT superfamily)